MDSVPSDYPAGDLRVSDADRDRAVSELSGHFQAGRLTIEEFEERSGRAVAARTGKDLAVLFDDLPRDRAAKTSPPPSGRVPAVRIGLVAPVLVGVLVGLALAFSHDGVRHYPAFTVGSGPNFGPLVGILLVLLVVVCLARRRR